MNCNTHTHTHTHIHTHIYNDANSANHARIRTGGFIGIDSDPGAYPRYEERMSAHLTAMLPSPVTETPFFATSMIVGSFIVAPE